MYPIDPYLIQTPRTPFLLVVCTSTTLWTGMGEGDGDVENEAAVAAVAAAAMRGEGGVEHTTKHTFAYTH